MKIGSLPSKGIRRDDSLRVEAVPADWTAEFYLAESRHITSRYNPKGTKGNSVPVFFSSSDHIALVQYFLRTYFLASKARRANRIPRDLVVDAD